MNHIYKAVFEDRFFIYDLFISFGKFCKTLVANRFIDGYNETEIICLY